ncbi:MAG: hypothetical protein KDN19_24135, partial [Verrucomicrobiae bacterium]|nr:hypothetical protein [Verrucomicrobiae bacterium]
GDADSVLASDPNGELRLYLPLRSSNQLVGSSLNGTAYAGANVDPLNQQIDEYVIHQLDTNGIEVLTPNEHDNLSNWGTNLLTTTATPDTSNYNTTLGNYSLYYDTITVLEAGPPVDPGTPGGGTAGGGAGSAGGNAGAGTGGGPGGTVDPGTGGGGDTTPPTVTVPLPGGGTIEVAAGPDGELPLFITLPDGTVGFSPGTLAPNAP